jgi:hypothetical protein
MIKIIDRQIVPGDTLHKRNVDYNTIDELIADELLLLDICGALVVLRPKHDQPIVYVQGLNQTNRWLYAPHARDAAALLTKHRLRDNVSIAMDYQEICQKTTYNIHKCASAQIITGGSP